MMWIAGGNKTANGCCPLIKSTDNGSTWSVIQGSISDWDYVNDIKYWAGKWVAVGKNADSTIGGTLSTPIRTSTDGINWPAATLNFSPPTLLGDGPQNWYNNTIIGTGVDFSGTAWLMSGYMYKNAEPTKTESILIRSTNGGLTWNTINDFDIIMLNPYDYRFESVIWSDNRWIAIGYVRKWSIVGIGIPVFTMKSIFYTTDQSGASGWNVCNNLNPSSSLRPKRVATQNNRYYISSTNTSKQGKYWVSDFYFADSWAELNSGLSDQLCDIYADSNIIVVAGKSTTTVPILYRNINDPQFVESQFNNGPPSSDTVVLALSRRAVPVGNSKIMLAGCSNGDIYTGNIANGNLAWIKGNNTIKIMIRCIDCNY